MLSVIIPTRESERALVRTLAHLVAGVATGLVREVIVADAGSKDATAEVSDVAGCRILVSSAPLAARLRDAAKQARAAWLMFLRPGTLLDATWVDETGLFIDHDERQDLVRAHAAVFRPGSSATSSRPLMSEALLLLRVALGATPRPEQGLLIPKQLYQQLGGHRDAASDPESDLMRRLGRRRIIMMRSAAVSVIR
jgi:Glycosyl transferase family 2